MKRTLPSDCLLDHCELVTEWPHPLAIVAVLVVMAVGIVATIRSYRNDN
jgi:hypothetical protein